MIRLDAIVVLFLFGCVESIELTPSQVSPSKPLTVDVSIDKKQNVTNTPIALVLNEISAPSSNAKLRVFLNLPAANQATALDHSNYLGSIAFFASDKPSSYRLSVPPRLASQIEGSAQVTIVMVADIDEVVEVGSVIIVQAQPAVHRP